MSGKFLVVSLLFYCRKSQERIQAGVKHHSNFAIYTLRKFSYIRASRHMQSTYNFELRSSYRLKILNRKYLISFDFEQFIQIVC